MVKEEQLSRGISDTMSQLQHEQGYLRNVSSQTPRHHRLWWQSSYDRGLDILLKMWPEIKAKYPDATLDICYGWNLFNTIAAGNPERMAWKEKMEELMKHEGITHHGRIGKAQMTKLRKQCGILAYPTYFTEISCIGVLEAQRDGVVPVTMTLAALKETVQSGIKIEGDIYDPSVQKAYLEALLSLMGDEKRWLEERGKGMEFAKTYDWSKIAKDWTKEFEKKPEDVKVSIITPTIRRGFWNIMANNIANQSYKNIEWIIVDDYKQNREETAKEYAKKYKLDIKYYRGKPRKTKRKFALVNANNTGLMHATGALLVILQDFVLMPETGIEQLVILAKQNPNALIAPVDEYYAPKIKPDTESEDWFHGELDVKGEFMRKNARVLNQGVRESQNPYEFEQNYCAIPRWIANELGGWWEFFDESLGFDNTDIAYRALISGFKLIVDDSNICVCIDHWKTLEGTEEHGLGRERSLSDPRYIWEMQMIDDGKLPVKRSQEIDDQIELLYTIPDKVPLGGPEVQWMRDNTQRLVTEWLEKYKEGFK